MDAGEEVKDIYNAVEKRVKWAKWTVRAAVVTVIVDVLSAGGLIALVMLALRSVAKGVALVAKSKVGKYGGKVGKYAAEGFAIVTILDDDYSKEVEAFLKDFFKTADYLSAPFQFAYGTKERMQRFGQLLGVVVASIAVSRAIIKEAKWKERWAKRGSSPKFVANHFVKTQLNINPIMPAIKLALYHYAQLVEKVIAETKQKFVEFEDKVENILLGDPKFRDIIEVDEGLTVSKLVAIVKFADDMVTEWLTQLAQIPGLSARIASMADSIGSLAPSKMPSLDQIANGDFRRRRRLGEGSVPCSSCCRTSRVGSSGWRTR